MYPTVGSGGECAFDRGHRVREYDHCDKARPEWIGPVPKSQITVFWHMDPSGNIRGVSQSESLSQIWTGFALRTQRLLARNTPSPSGSGHSDIGSYWRHVFAPSIFVTSMGGVEYANRL